MHSGVILLISLLLLCQLGQSLIEISDCGTELQDNGWTASWGPNFQQCIGLHYTNTSSYLGNSFDYPHYTPFANFPPPKSKELDGYGIWLIIPTWDYFTMVSNFTRDATNLLGSTSVQLGIRFYVAVNDPNSIWKNNSVLFISPVLPKADLEYYRVWDGAGFKNSTPGRWSEARVTIDLNALKVTFFKY
jgi:hypothetical protein